MASKKGFLLVAILVFSSKCAGQQQQVTCHACDSVQMPDCADPFVLEGSHFTCDYTEPIGQIGRALHAPESSFSQITSELQSAFPARFLPPGNDDLPPGQCAKFTIIKEGHPPIIIRGCSRHGNNTCSYVRQATELFKGKLDECDICEGDLCNASSALSGCAALIFLFSILKIFY